MTSRTPKQDARAVLLRLERHLVKELHTVAAHERQVVGGDAPRLRINGISHDLKLSTAYNIDLYASAVPGQPTQRNSQQLDQRKRLFRIGTICERAEVSKTVKDGDAEKAEAAAAAALEERMASLAKEKKALEPHMTGVMPNPHKRHGQVKKTAVGRRHLQQSTSSRSPASPSNLLTMTELDPSLASQGTDPRLVAAYKHVLSHFLAMGPATLDTLHEKTKIPRKSLSEAVSKIAQTTKQDENLWELRDRAYKDLDVWKFKFPGPSDRKSAVDNAIRAFDRLRIGKDEKIWQLLLPPSERNKGKVLSKLNLGGPAAARGLTPQHPSNTYSATSDAAGDGNAVAVPAASKLGRSPKPTTSKTGGLSKRLFSKDPAKARAIEDAKEKKRKEREAAKNDAPGDKDVAERPAKRQNIRKPDPKIKSAEFVHSSDDESGEANDAGTPKPRAANQSASREADSVSRSKPAPVRNTKPASSRSGGTSLKTVASASSTVKKQENRPSLAAHSHARVAASTPDVTAAQRTKANSSVSSSVNGTMGEIRKPSTLTQSAGKAPAAVPAASSTKRKAPDLPASRTVVKHRKTDSVSSQSVKSNSSLNQNSTEHTSPDSSSDSSTTAANGISFGKGVSLAEKFRDHYYPAYAKMYDEQLAKESRGETVSKEDRERLWRTHRRLEQMKKEIELASKRKHLEEG